MVFIIAVDEAWHRLGAEALAKLPHVVYHTHLHETVAEREQYESKVGKTALQSLHDAGRIIIMTR